MALALLCIGAMGVGTYELTQSIKNNSTPPQASTTSQVVNNALYFSNSRNVMTCENDNVGVNKAVLIAVDGSSITSGDNQQNFSNNVNCNQKLSNSQNLQNSFSNTIKQTLSSTTTGATNKLPPGESQTVYNSINTIINQTSLTNCNLKNYLVNTTTAIAVSGSTIKLPSNSQMAKNSSSCSQNSSQTAQAVNKISTTVQQKSTLQYTGTLSNAVNQVAGVVNGITDAIKWIILGIALAIILVIGAIIIIPLVFIGKEGKMTDVVKHSIDKGTTIANNAVDAAAFAAMPVPGRK